MFLFCSRGRAILKGRYQGGDWLPDGCRRQIMALHSAPSFESLEKLVGTRDADLVDRHAGRFPRAIAGAGRRPTRRAVREGKPRGGRRRLGDRRGAQAVRDHRAHRARQDHHHPQREPGHRLRSLDQRLSRLRARVLLLFCAADPFLSRPFGGHRFRARHLCEGQCRRAAAARARQSALQGASRSPWAPTPTPTSRPSASTS